MRYVSFGRPLLTLGVLARATVRFPQCSRLIPFVQTCLFTHGVVEMDKGAILAVRASNLGPACQIFFSHDPLNIVRAKDHYMYTCDGKRYIDCINNVCHVGHSHPRIAQAAFNQLMNLNTNSRYLYEPMAMYLQKLCSILPEQLSSVYFANSGSEATDLALRLARIHSGSKETITLDHAYHGHVISAWEISPYKWKQMNSTNEKPSYVHVVPCPDVYRGKHRAYDEKSTVEAKDAYVGEVRQVCEDLKAEGKHAGVFIAESLQSCGGQIIYPPGYLADVYETVRANGGVCIADEVQVGFGRMGKHWWGFENAGVVPDIVTIGKPMGNGFPIAAVITTKEIAASFASSGIEFFNTYGGNPVSCMVGLEVLKIIEEEKLRENAEHVGGYLLKRAQEMREKYSKIIGDVRGVGLFVGIDLVADPDTREPLDKKRCDEILNEMRERGILLSLDGPYSNVLKFKPPMTFGIKDVDEVMSNLDAVLSAPERASSDA